MKSFKNAAIYRDIRLVAIDEAIFLFHMWNIWDEKKLTVNSHNVFVVDIDCILK